MAAHWRALACTTLLVVATAATAPERCVAQQPHSPPSAVTDEPQSQPSIDARTASSSARLDLDADKLRKVEHWYGWQTLSVDGASVAFALGAYLSHSASPLWAAITGYLFGAPFVHLVHRNFGGAATSLGLRIVLPLVVGVSTLFAPESCDDEADSCGVDALVISLPIVVLAMIVIDATVLARETLTEPATVQPVAAIKRDQLFLGVRGVL